MTAEETRSYPHLKQSQSNLLQGHTKCFCLHPIKVKGNWMLSEQVPTNFISKQRQTGIRFFRKTPVLLSHKYKNNWCIVVINILTFLNAGLSITALQSYSRTPTHSQTAFILALRFLHTWHILHLRDVGSDQFPGGGSEEIKKKTLSCSPTLHDL